MLSPEDRALLAEIEAAVAEHDPVPQAVVDAAKGSFAWRTVDAELAELAEDSLLVAGGVRSGGGPRMLTFEAGSTAVVLQVLDAGDTRRLTGQLVAPQPAQVEVRWRDGRRQVLADDLGRFTVEDVPAGPVSLACRFPRDDRPPLVTAWVTV